MNDGNSAPRYDVLVIGAGIHGVGVLQAAAAAGYRALLLEERAAASGTSSRSSKLIHGGLRYLEHGELRLVRESLRERAILVRIAPELVKLVPFFVPIYRTTRRRPWQIRAGLSLYALLGDGARHARFHSVPRHEWSTLDGLSTDGLEAVYRYFDGQTDDAALVRAVLRSALELGAEYLCPAEFVSAERDESGYAVRYRANREERTAHASALVNAAGPWVDVVRERIAPRPPAVGVELVGGAHVEIEGTIERGIYYAEAPSDARAVFVMPWKGRTLIGTTETRYTGDPRLVAPTSAEIDYLLATFRHYFPGRAAEVRDAWAGLRVLPKRDTRAFERPRETTLVRDDPARARMVAIYGGKLTGYRATALKVLEVFSRTLPTRTRVADTAEIALEPDRSA